MPPEDDEKGMVGLGVAASQSPGLAASAAERGSGEAPRPIVLLAISVDIAVPFYSELARRLSEEGMEVHFASSGGPNLEALSGAVSTHILPTERQPSPLRDLRSLWLWFSLIGSVKPDLVLTGTPKTSLLGMVAARLMGVPVRIYFNMGLRLETASGIGAKALLALERLTASCATAVLAVSDSIEKRLIELRISVPEKVTVVGAGSVNGVDLSQFRPAHDAQETRELREASGLDPCVPTVGFVGRMTTDKGIAELRDALVALRESGQDVQALLVGGAEDELGASVVDDLRARDIRVAAPGHVADPAPYMREMDVFCLPSYREGFGSVLLEAQASGVPVVATAVTGVVNVIEDGVTGVLVPARDSSALSQAIQEVLCDDAKRGQLVKRGSARARSAFSRERVVGAQVKWIFGQLTTHSGHPPAHNVGGKETE